MPCRALSAPIRLSSSNLRDRKIWSPGSSSQTQHKRLQVIVDRFPRFEVLQRGESALTYCLPTFRLEEIVSLVSPARFARSSTQINRPSVSIDNNPGCLSAGRKSRYCSIASATTASRASAIGGCASRGAFFVLPLHVRKLASAQRQKPLHQNFFLWGLG